MTLRSHRSLRLTVLSFLRNHYAGAGLLLLLTMLVPGAHAITATTTTLTISSISVPYKTPIILTATVTATGGAPVTAGFVLFCDATATFCENNTSLGRVQLTAANATAVVKIGSGPLGIHSYKAVYHANNTYESSVSNKVSYTVQGTYSTTTTILSSGSVGNYTLMGNVTGIGSLLAAPGGNISFLDLSAGNKILGTQILNAGVVSEVFTQAPNSPFGIAQLPSTNNYLSRSLAIASNYINGDNNLDVVTANTDQTVTILIGNGNGSFQPKVNYSGCVTGSAQKILLADFNRDGNIDIALSCSDGAHGGLVIMLGNGDGTFQTAVPYSSGAARGLALGDFNSDGILDIAVADSSQEDITIFIGNGDGSFKPGVISVNTPRQVNDVVVADFDGDGNDDLAYVVNSADPSSNLSDLYVALGKGNGNLKASVLAASNIGEFLTVGDIDGNNVPDIVSTTVQHKKGVNVGNSLFVLIGNGDGTFQPTATYVSDIPSDPHLADVNGDGKPDIIAGGSYGALVYLGNGDGTFQAYSEPVIGGFDLTYAVNAGDYNNDGNADLIGTDANNPRAAVSLSEVQQVADANALTGVALFPLGSGTHNVDASYLGNSIYVGSTSSTIQLRAAPTPTTLSLVASPTSATLSGQSVALTATLNPYTVGPPTTTTDGESVKFFNGATSLGSGVLHGGVATLTTTALPADNDTLQAAFPGDINYNPSSSSSVSVTVASILLTSSPNPSTYGQTVTFIATVPSGELGNVTFKDGGTTLRTVALSSSAASFTTSTLTAGSHDITAVYSGDSSHGTPAATSPIVTQVVNAATPLLAVATSGQSTYGDLVTITAALSLSGPTGTVVFTSGSTTLGTGTVSASGTATITASTLPAGSDPITAAYGGDKNYNNATGSTTQTVGKRTPVTSLTSSTNPSLIGASVVFTDSLPTGLTGTVTFANGSTILGTYQVSGITAGVTTSALPLGSDVITATYSGDANNNASKASLTQTVNKATPTVIVTTSGQSTYGATVTITASVPPGPTGTITFTSGGTSLGSGALTPSGTVVITTTALPVGTDTITASYSGDDNNNANQGTTTLVVGKTTPTVTVTTSGPSNYGDPVTITVTVPPGTNGNVTITSGGNSIGTGTISSGTVTITTTTLPVGTDPIVVSYGGDGNNNPASGTATQVVSKLTPSVTLSSSVNPSMVNQSVTFTATVPVAISGTVTFFDAAAVLGTATVSNGVAAITTSTLLAGAHTVTANYSGDQGNNSANSLPLTQTVNKENPVLPAPSVSSTNTTVGNSETISETVPPGVSGPVTFYDGSTPIGTAPIVSGVATITVNTLPVGTDPITASTPSDANNNSATSPPTIVTVIKTTPTIKLISSINPSSAGQSVTFTATGPNGATGSLVFFDGAATLATIGLTNGQASFTTNSLTAGSHTITADYSGDSSYTAANSAPLTQTVNKGTPALPPPAVSSPTLPSGTSETISETVPSGVIGPVTFYNGSTAIGTSSIVNGVASITITLSTIGTDSITASTPADANNNAATSPPTLVTVTKMTPSLPPPTVSTTTPTPDTPVTITEPVPPGVTGPITFNDGPTVIGTAPVVNGVATITVPSLPIGSNPITATTPGGDTSNAATSPVTPVVVSKAIPTVVLTSSANPAEFNQVVTFTAAVPAAASGTMTFRDGAVVLGTVTVNAGIAVLTTSNLTIGSHAITAAYGGNSSYDVATSAPLGQVVGKIPTAITLGQSAPAQLLHNMVTFAATVIAATPTPTGTVTFLEGTTVLGTTALNTNGTVVALAKSGNAAYATSGLTTGSHQIVAVYSGDASFSPSTSAPVTYIVQDFTNAVNGVASQNVFPGDKTSYKFDLAPLGATTFLSDLNLTVAGLPAGTTYTFTPATIAAGSGTTSVVLNITTNSSLSAQSRMPKGDPTSQHGLPIALGMMGLFGLGVVRKYRRKMPRMLTVLLLLLGSLLPVAGLSGCAGGYFTLTPTTYSVSVTGTEGLIQHTATATLVVQ
ncbi:MAG TPA: Ig-like domain repeat protein [Edaphobacter sp.]|nr:Ig-like domain repeat protein [Edaphobacter sp.]